MFIKMPLPVQHTVDKEICVEIWYHSLLLIHPVCVLQRFYIFNLKKFDSLLITWNEMLSQ
jgi:hypothetical protein